ncbi:uncharacterized protein LOC133779044 [Humulus lupulus]|uniref:uncharacterized protein LOC133779044 n=1 Tax=Humulus lupulus TaxID=3486 RepID=UPI002B415F39|nr:uncharacterized protein LOC133779044 [Humulus lupulus]
MTSLNSGETISPAITATAAVASTSTHPWNPFSNSLTSSLTVKLDRSSISEGVLASVATYSTYLAITGCCISDQDLELQLLNGLGPEYDSIVSTITSSSELKIIEEIQALLMAHECCLERHHSIADILGKMAKNLTFISSRTMPSHTYRPNYGSGRGSSTDMGSRTVGRNYYCVPPSSTCPLCQVCLKLGHIAAKCHYCFDKKFVTPKNTNAQRRAYLTEQECHTGEIGEAQAYISTSVPDFGDDSP